MTAAAPIEELLREALDRLDRRTTALEAAVFEGPPALSALTVELAGTHTPTPRSADAPVVAWSAPRWPEPGAPSGAPGSGPSVAAVVDSLDDVIWSVSPDGRQVLFAGGAVERLYGVPAREFLDRPGGWLDAVWPDDRDRLETALARLADTGTFRLEHRVRRPNRDARWAVTRGNLVRDPDGRPLRVDGSTTDVAGSARTRDAVLAVLAGVGPATGADFLFKLTRLLCEACGARAAVVAEPGAAGEVRTVAAWVDGRAGAPVALPAGAGAVRDLLAGGAAFAPAAAGTCYPDDPLVLKLRAEALAAEPLADAAGRWVGFVAVADDRAFAPDADTRAVLRALAPRVAVELARAAEPPAAGGLEARLAAAEARAAAAEAALRASANLASAGRFAAGVAHDFHNLLGVIVGNADLLREGLPESDPQHEYAETIARTAHTVAAVSRQLVAIGRPTAQAPAPLDVANAVRALEPMLDRLLGRKIPLAFDLGPGLPLVRADATDFDRVVLNLVLNARDASRPGDTVTVRVTTDLVGPGRAGWPAGLPAGEYVAVTVADQGCGMSAEVREKMFDLFFTTKGASGTGLGLATVRDAVRAARGHIEVESDPGWGTTIRVYWPPL